MAHRLLRDEDADGWERSDFPIICESCLGANPYVRMTKANFDKECKICTRPFTVFRWRPGRDARYKKTEICQTCCKLKNVCQVCMLDLEYGLPVQVRDTALGIDTTDSIPKSDVNKEYFAEEHDRKARAGLDYESSFGKSQPNDLLLKLQRTTPYYKRNRAHICSFFVRGECTRGSECPYRHEMPITGELAHQNFKDRYYGVNDPVAKKLLQRAEEMPKLEAPEDESITTLFVAGLDSRVKEEDIRDQFYAYGEIESVRIIASKGIAFISYTTRDAAEKAAAELNNKLLVKGLRLKLSWGRPKEQKEGDEKAPGAELERGKGSSSSAGLLGPASVGPASSVSLYPSMNPERMGARPSGEGNTEPVAVAAAGASGAGAGAGSAGSGTEGGGPPGVLPPPRGPPPPGYPPHGGAPPPPGYYPHGAQHPPGMMHRPPMGPPYGGGMQYAPPPYGHYGPPPPFMPRHVQQQQQPGQYGPQYPARPSGQFRPPGT